MWAVQRRGMSSFDLLSGSGGRFNGTTDTIKRQDMKESRPSSSAKNKRPFAISSIGQQSKNWPAAKISRIDVKTSSVIMVCNVNRKKLNCQQIFNLFSCYGKVLKVKFLRHKDICMVEMKSGTEVGIVCKYLNRFKAFGTHLKLEYQFRTSSLSYDRINDFSVSCGGDSFVNFSDSSRVFKPIPMYPSRELHFSGMSTGFTNDQIEQLLFKTAKDGPLPIFITRYRPRAGHSLNGFMTFKSTEQATEAIMLYNFAPISDSQILNLYYRNN